jgi:hypothetical protein
MVRKSVLFLNDLCHFFKKIMLFIKGSFFNFLEEDKSTSIPLVDPFNISNGIPILMNSMSYFFLIYYFMILSILTFF